jgi:hypothetical protein
MKKNQYILELKTQKPYVKFGMENDPDVRKVQEWINLWKRYNSNWAISTAIDGDLGPSTLAAVKAFQEFHNLRVDGIVGNITWRKLTEPMQKAFTRIDGVLNFKELVVKYAEQHLKSAPREFKQNEGTWVRAYMDGHEGAPWAWCVGFVQTIVDQAAFTVGKALGDYMPFTYSCDVLGNYGLKNKRLIRNEELKKDARNVEAGDVFLNVKTPYDWVHTGIITKVEGDWFHTIEGNTNDEGSREGYEVCLRKRNFKTKNIDVFAL